MARLTFPNAEDRLVYTIEGASDFRPAVARKIRVYSNSAGTTLANIQTLAGAAIANSELTVDSNSLLPEFLGPDSGTPDSIDTLYVKPVGGTIVTKITANTDSRLDALQDSVDNFVAGTGFIVANGTTELGAGTAYLNHSLVRGGSTFFLDGSFDTGAIISAKDYVQFHNVLGNTAAVPNVWGINTVAIKERDTTEGVDNESNVYGIEISVSNNRDETGPVQENGQLTGLFVSYISTVRTASAAISVGGLSHGWKHGLWIDAITPTGVGITLQDNVGPVPHIGMGIGIDMRGVASFVDGAIMLGNEHRIAANKTTGEQRTILKMSANDRIHIGDSTNPTGIHLYTNENLRVTGLVNAVAVAGTNPVPANAQTFLQVEINGVFGRIPVFN